MAYEYRNLAYDLRLFEDEEMYSSAVKAPEKHNAKSKPKREKKNIEVDKPKSTIRKVKRRKNNFVNISVAVVLAVMVVIVVGLIIHGQVQLTEVNHKITAAQKTLEEQQSLYTQLQMKVDASISTAVVEKYAKERLGMSKVANSQKEFISLSEGDKVEIASDSNDNVFDSVADAFSSSGA
ncbi:MAG: septum formation initiator family protein [Eubacteriales bacterium]|nr:septum formation initiator family protein [Eubacteriales bacterium]